VGRPRNDFRVATFPLRVERPQEFLHHGDAPHGKFTSHFGVHVFRQVQQFVVEVVDRGGAVRSHCGAVWVPDRPAMGSAERERARDTDRAERIEAVSVGECLVLEGRLRRVARPSGPPVMMLDALSDGRDRACRRLRRGPATFPPNGW
jgi:hypothetical protein